MTDCLVIDESPVIRKVAVRILESAGFSVAETGDAAEALMTCRRDMPRLILLDGALSGMSGVDFLKSLRKMDGGKAPKVVYTLTDQDVAHMARANRAGANLYLQKPFDREILLARIAEAGLRPKAA